MRLRGGAGRTRTNHQSVMEDGSSPTNSPGRTPIQIAGRFAALGPRLPTRHAQVHGSYGTNTGKVILALSISAGDPERTMVGMAFVRILVRNHTDGGRGRQK